MENNTAGSSARQKAEVFARTWFERDGYRDIAQAICTGATLTDSQMDRLQATMETPAGVVLRACFFTIYAPPGGDFERIGLQILEKFVEDLTETNVFDPTWDRQIVRNIMGNMVQSLIERGDKDTALAEARKHLEGIERLEENMKAVMNVLSPSAP